MALDTEHPPQRNSLHVFAAVNSLLLGVFLMAGASGHFIAVWPAIDSSMKTASAFPFALLVPGLVLAVTGVLNSLLCRGLWLGKRLAIHVALAFNAIAFTYLAYLLSRGIPGHPIGLFTALVSSHVVLLLAIRLGLVWPAVANQQDDESWSERQ